jgi:hypothetical protein
MVALTLTGPANPLRLLRVTVVVPLVPRWMLEIGVAEMQ